MKRRRPGPLLLLFAIATAAVTYAVAASFTAEREYEALVHQLGSGDGARVLDSRFSRGWLSSRAKTSIESGGAPGVLFQRGVVALGAVDVRARVGINMSHEIEHGLLPLIDWAWNGFEGRPVVARLVSTLEIDQESQLALSETIGKLPALDAETVIRTSGQALTVFTIPAHRLHARGGGIDREGRWLGLDGELEFTNGFRRVRGFVRSPGFENRGEERMISLRDVTWVFELPGSELPVGQVSLEIGKMTFDYTTAGAVPIELDGLQVTGESKLGAGSFGGSVDASLRALRLGDERWGPGTLRAVMSNVDGQGFRRLRNASQHLQAERDQSDPAKTAAMAATLLEALPQLLAREPRLDLERFQIRTPSGVATASGVITLVAPVAGEPISAPSFLHGELQAELPERALEQIVDARVRAALTSEGADASDEAAFEAQVNARRASELAELRKVGFTQQGDRATLNLTWGGANVARTEPAASPAPARPSRPHAPPAPPASDGDPDPATAPAPAAPAP